MYRILRPFLILAIVLTAQSLALARGQTMVAGEMVLCLGGEAVTVTVDAEGKPTGPAHICPDMALGLMAAFQHDLPVPVSVQGQGRALSVIAAVPVAALAELVPSARGPPLSV
jgi:hypothetical protein